MIYSLALPDLGGPRFGLTLLDLGTPWC